jgi:precorrin-6B methylase 2
MTNRPLRWVLSSLQTIAFEYIGSIVQTNAFKGFMDILFIVLEKVGSKFQVISALYLDLYRDIVSKESALLKLTKNEKVLVIGGGSLPATPMLIAMSTGARIDLIDKDPEAVATSQQFIRTYHLEDKLKVINANGLQYPLASYNVIIILYGVKQPEKVLEYIASQATEKTRIILRVITDDQGNIGDKTLDITKQFIIKGRVRSTTLGSFESLMLQKKP